MTNLKDIKGIECNHNKENGMGTWQNHTGACEKKTIDRFKVNLNDRRRIKGSGKGRIEGKHVWKITEPDKIK
jgi:hypothetical protein